MTNTFGLRLMFMTAKEAATALKVHQRTIRRWVQSGKLRGETIGKITLVLRVDVRNLRLKNVLPE